MRISDWSSDVCSSDLLGLLGERPFVNVVTGGFGARVTAETDPALKKSLGGLAYLLTGVSRSEEHTSELQSLMRISYAVFCLKRNNGDQSAGLEATGEAVRAHTGGRGGDESDGDHERILVES